MREQEEARYRLKAKRAREGKDKQVEQQPKHKKGHAADDDLDLIPVARTANITANNRTLHFDLHDAPIRRLDEPYPSES